MSTTDAEAFEALMGDKKWTPVDTSPTGSSKSWEPEKGEKIVGVYKGSRKVATKFGEREIYTLETVDGDVDVWETSQLKRAFAKLAAGTEMRLTYNGKVLPEKGNAYKDFLVEV